MSPLTSHLQVTESMNLTQDLVHLNKTVLGRNVSSPWETHEVVVFMEKYYSLGLLVVGTIGNLLCLAVLSRQTFRRSSIGIYLRFLTLADLMALYTGVLYFTARAVFNINFRKLDELSCKFHRWLSFAACDLSSWALVLVSTARLISIAWPMKRLITRRRVYISILITVPLILAVNLPVYIIYGNVQDVARNKTKLCVLTTDSYADFYNYVFSWIVLAKFNFLPFVLLIVLNSALVTSVYRSGKAVSQFQASSATSSLMAATTMKIQLSKLRQKLNAGGSRKSREVDTGHIGLAKDSESSHGHLATNRKTQRIETSLETFNNILNPQKAADGSQKGDATPLKAADGSQKGDVTPLKASDGSQKGDVTLLKAADGSQKGDVTPLKAADGSQKGDVTPLKVADGTQKGDVTPLKAADGSQKGDVTPLKGADGSQKGDISPLKVDDGSQKGDVIPLKVVDGSQKGDMSPQKEAAGSQKDDVSPLKIEDGSQKGDVSLQKAANGFQKGDVSPLKVEDESQQDLKPTLDDERQGKELPDFKMTQITDKNTSNGWIVAQNPANTNVCLSMWKLSSFSETRPADNCNDVECSPSYHSGHGDSKDTKIRGVLGDKSQKLGRVDKIHETSLGASNRYKSSIEQQGGSAISRSRSLTKTLLVLNTVFLVTTTPITVYLTGKTYFWPNTSEYSATQDIAATVANFIMYTNNAINFILYCVTGSKFRGQLVLMFTELGYVLRHQVRRLFNTCASRS